MIPEPTEAMIEAGIVAWTAKVIAMEDRERSATPENMPDYDEGDICAAIYLAMEAAREPEAESIERNIGRRLAREKLKPLTDEDRVKGYVEPFRIDYIHEKCGGRTTMPRACAETYAVQPEYCGSTFCCHCLGYFPVGENGEFIWNDGSRQKVGTRRAA